MRLAVALAASLARAAVGRRAHHAPQGGRIVVRCYDVRIVARLVPA